MLDGPILALIGMSVVSCITALAVARRKRHPRAAPSENEIATMSSAQLMTTLNNLPPSVPEYELVRRRVTLLVIDELNRRSLPQDHER